MSGLDKVLRENEKVLWSSKPARIPFVVPHSLMVIAFGLFFMFVSVFILTMMMSQGAPFPFNLFPLLFFFVGFLVAFGEPIYMLMAYRNTEYMITDQRVIIQTGAIGLDTRFVDLDKIQEVRVDVGVIDKIFGTGSVRIPTAGYAGYVYAGRRGYGGPRDFLGNSLAALKKPYEVQNILQEAIVKARRP